MRAGIFHAGAGTMRLCASSNGRAGLFGAAMRRRGDGVRPERCAALTRRPQCGFHLMRLRIIICQQIVSRRGDGVRPERCAALTR